MVRQMDHILTVKCVKVHSTIIGIETGIINNFVAKIYIYGKDAKI